MRQHHRCSFCSQISLSLVAMFHWDVGGERHRWGPWRAEAAETSQRLRVVSLGEEGAVREFILQGESRHLLAPLSPFTGLLLCTQKGEGRKKVRVKW